MSLQSRLEKELLTLSSANFQKLGDAYLRRKHGWALQSWGTVAGADKDKTGVPDSYAQLPDGRYVLVAYTTTAPPKLAGKLAEDLADCAREASRHLVAGSVERIVLVYNNRISLAAHDQLGRQAAILGYPLQIMGLDDVAAMILSYPPLAAELLPLDWARGQLVQWEEFIAITQRQFTATPFTDRLIGRETEQQLLRQQLATAPLVLICGPAGVGKTQLVLTTGQAYCAEDPTHRQLYFVYDKKSADFIRELQFVLEPGQEIVVVADDANRILPYFSQLLAEQAAHPAGTLKIVATVRDYAREAVTQVARQVDYAEVEIKPLSEEVLRELLAAEPYGIRNQRYVERILELSGGRPRLAIMAALAAKETQQLARLHNVADIYERYLGPLLDELAARHSPHLIQVLALLHFFRVVRQDNAELQAQLAAAFGISPKEFWNAAQELYEAEVVEMHEGRVVKSSDQTLGNFAFYRVFFGKRPSLSYQQLLLAFFESWQGRVVDTLNGLLNDFDFDNIDHLIRPALHAWLRQADLTTDQRWKFYHTFWPFLPGEALAAAQRHLDALPWPGRPARDYTVVLSNERSPSFESPVLAVLKDLAGHPSLELPTALGLLLELAAKQPDQFNQVLDFFQHGARFDFRQHEHYGLARQQAMLDALLSGTQEPERADFHWWVLAHMLPASLATSFHGIYPSRQPNSVTMARYELPFDELPVQAWRQHQWQAVFDLFAVAPDLALQVIAQYPEQQHNGQHSDRWAAWDARQLLPFLADRLDAANFAHCQLVHGYVQWLTSRVQLPEAVAIRGQFTSPRYRLYDLLLFERPYELGEDEEDYLRLWGDEREKLLGERLASLRFPTLPEYEHLLQEYYALHTASTSPHEQRQMIDAMAVVLAEVLARDRALGLRVVQALFITGNPTGLCPQTAIRQLASQDYAAGYDLLTAHDYRGRSCWQLRYLTHLPAELANATWLAELRRVFGSDLSLVNFNGLEVYAALSPTLYPDLLAQVLDWAAATTEPVAVQYDFISLFGVHFGPGHLPLLKQLYQQQAAHYRHFDVKGEYLLVILRQDPDFLLELLGPDNQYGTRFERQPLHFLWKLPDAEQVLTQVLADIAASPSYRRDRLADTFFAKPPGAAEQGRLEALLARLLQRPDLPAAQASVLVYSVQHSLPERLPYFLNLLLQSRPDNPNGMFQQLQLIPTIRTSSSRSRIPQHRTDMALWEAVRQTIDQQPRLTAGLRAYRTYVLRQLDSLRQQIDYEAEQDFSDPY